MNYQSTLTQPSQSCPGVHFTIRRLSEGLRITLRRQLAAAFSAIADAEAARDEFFARLAEIKGKPFDTVLISELTPRERRELDAVLERMALIQDTEIHPAYFDAAFVSASGIFIDNAAPDAEAVRQRGPSVLYREILAAILAEAGLSPEQRSNLESPSTSGAAVDGKTSDTSAPPASVKDSTGPVTATSTSPKP